MKKIKSFYKYNFIALLMVSIAFLSACHYIPEAPSSRGLGKVEEKPYTILIYMNGSDLESRNGDATKDIQEILGSGLSGQAANVVLFTGGTNRWKNNLIPDNECVIWEVKDGALAQHKSLGLISMGVPETLSDFIDYGMEKFPARQYGLILWDHGGGSISGYGADEKFDYDHLSLMELEEAFANSQISKEKLEFLGFDSCLMASIEMADIASNYANYLIASEDLEPGEGWDYGFLSALNWSLYGFSKEIISGKELGEVITDSFIDYYGTRSNLNLNLSVVDLSKTEAVMKALGNLAERVNSSRKELKTTNTPPSLPISPNIVSVRENTRTFGLSSENTTDSDMVDLGSLATQFSDLYPQEAETLLMALNAAIVYNKNNDKTEVSGLSAFFLYYNMDMAEQILSIYNTLDVDVRYKELLFLFSKNRS